MKKAITAAALTAAMLSQSVCLAAYDATVKNGKIVVSGDELQAGEVINITAFPTGTNKFTADNLIGVTEVTADKDGKISVEIGVRTDKEQTKNADGITVYIKGEDDDTPTSKEVSFSIKKYNEFMAAMKTEAGIKAAFANSDYADTIRNLGMESYFTISSDKVKEDVVKLFNGCLDRENVSPKNVLASYEKAYAVAMLNAKQMTAAEMLAETDPSFEGTKYSEITDESLKSWLVSQAGSRTYGTVAVFETAYTTDNMLYVINNAGGSGIAGKLGLYAKDLGIESNTSYKKYTSLGTTEKGKASYSISGTLESTPAKTAAELTTVISSAVGSGSGNGSGGGVIQGGTKGNPSIAGGSASSSNSSNQTNSSNGQSTASKSGFTDMGSVVTWADEAVTYLALNGIVNGVSENEFAPNDAVTREQFVKMAVNAAGIKTEGASSDFTDVDKNEWYYEYISAGVNAGLINGVSDTEFGLGKVVTRQDAAVILYRAAQAMGIELDGGSVKSFSDKDAVADYAEEAVAAMSAAGIIEGNEDGEFMPLNGCTRAQAAVIIYRMFFK